MLKHLKIVTEIEFTCKKCTILVFSIFTMLYCHLPNSLIFLINLFEYERAMFLL